MSIRLKTSSKLKFAAFEQGAKKFGESTEIVHVARNTVDQK